MLCIAVVEVIVLGIFNFWPIQEGAREKQKPTFGGDAFFMEEAIITRQASTPPAPPKPQMPVPQPTDEVIEEEITTLDQFALSDYSDSLSVNEVGSAGNSDEVVSSPQRSPSVIRIVEATVPQAAKEANIKAEITVSFLVNEKGKVEDASIAQVKLYDRKTGEVKITDSIGYGLTKATLEAALQWQFTPARDNGKAVKAYTKQVFTYGF